MWTADNTYQVTQQILYNCKVTTQCQLWSCGSSQGRMGGDWHPLHPPSRSPSSLVNLYVDIGLKGYSIYQLLIWHSLRTIQLQWLLITAWRKLQISNTWVAIIWMWGNTQIATTIHRIRVIHNDRIFMWLPVLGVVATYAVSQATLSARVSSFQLRFFLKDKENDWQSCNYMYTVEHHTLEFPATCTP